MTTSESKQEKRAREAYEKWSQFYSQKNWLYNWPFWGELSKEEHDWWIKYVAEISSGFSFAIGTSEPAK